MKIVCEIVRFCGEITVFVRKSFKLATLLCKTLLCFLVLVMYSGYMQLNSENCVTTLKKIVHKISIN